MQFKHRLWSDLETRSGVQITRGSYVYGEDSELLLYLYALDEGAVGVWDAAMGEPMPRDLHDYLSAPEVELAFHNKDFDRVQLYGWPWAMKYPMPLERFYCTMQAARICGLPGSLDALCRVLGVPEQYAKKDGDALIRRFCIPDDTGRYVQPWDDPTGWQKFREYGVHDVVAMREAMRLIPTYVFNDVERQLSVYTDLMNDRGIPIDRTLAMRAMAQAEALKKHAKRDANKILQADGRFSEDEFNPASQKAILEICKEYGILLEDARSATLEKLLDRDVVHLLPPTLQKLLAIRFRTHKTSVTKYKAVLQCTSRDGRARGLVSYGGAQRTARDAGRRFQPQNLARPKLLGKNLSMEQACDIVKSGNAELLFENPMQLLSDCVRGVIAPEKGRKLCVADLASIEGRVLPWLSNEHWKTQYFRDLDAGVVKYDSYELAYAVAFGVDPSTVTKEQRTLGKPIDLACIAEGTPVLTKRGMVAIEEVIPGDLVWDGAEWVETDGAVYRGVRHVIEYAGLVATTDHIVWTRELGPVEFSAAAQQCASLVRTELVGRPLRAMVDDGVADALEGPALAVPVHRLPSAGLGGDFGSARRALDAVQHLRDQAPRGGSARPVPVVAGEAGAGYAATVREPEGQGLQKLWCKGCSLLLRLIGRSSRVDSPEPGPSAAAGTGSHRLDRPLCPGQPAVPAEAGEPGQPAARWRSGVGACGQAEVPRDTVRRQHVAQPVQAGAIGGTGAGAVAPAVVQAKRRVWDLLNCGPRNRFSAGGYLVHNCGYGGGVGALISFAAVYHIDIDDMAAKARAVADPCLWAECADSYDWFHEKGRTYGLAKDTWIGCQYIIQAWRLKHPMTKAGWKKAEDAFRAAIRNPGTTFEAARGCYYRKEGNWLFGQLPSGRLLCYPMAQEVERPGQRDPQLMFAGVNPFTKQWGWIFTYAGKLVENWDQALSRDIFFWNIPHLEAAGYAGILRVHDEFVAETPDEPRYSGEHMAQIIRRPHQWCHDLPLNAKGETLFRYDK